MKLLVSTRETQGKRASDFCFVPDGEFVVPGHMCGDEKPDDSCGCRRSMVGVYCHKATTTVKVVNSTMSITEFQMLVGRETVDNLIQAVTPYEVGTILECRDGELKPR